MKLRRDPVEGRLGVAGLEAALGGKSLPKPRGILSGGAALLPCGISSEDRAFPAPVGSDVVSAALFVP